MYSCHPDDSIREEFALVMCFNQSEWISALRRFGKLTTACLPDGRLLSPLWGEEGSGGSLCASYIEALERTPIPVPSPQGGRERVHRCIQFCTSSGNV